MKEAVVKEAQRFPPKLGLKVTISECAIDLQGALTFRKQQWIPDFEILWTGLVQEARDSPLTGHPGREQTYLIVS